MRSLDVFLNFAVQDMNRNVFWRNPDRVSDAQIGRMNLFWGDESWRNVVYDTSRNLFGIPEKEPNEIIAEAFRKRLLEVAGFQHVPEPIPMRNSNGAILYYLFFPKRNPGLTVDSDDTHTLSPLRDLTLAVKRSIRPGWSSRANILREGFSLDMVLRGPSLLVR
jgi:hypothetical protein